MSPYSRLNADRQNASLTVDGETAPALQAAYGDPPERLAALPAGARQFSPLVPGSDALEETPEGSLASMTMLAPPGTLERRSTLGLMLRALLPGAPFTVLAPKDMGGSRLRAELAAFGCTVDVSSKSHHRLCRGTCPAAFDNAEMQAALAGGAPRRLDDLGLWSQPGIFSWDRVDPGTALLIQALPRLAGHGADLGCGIGVLAHAVLASSAVSALHLIDIDRRAIEAARRNVGDPRVRFAWADVRAGTGATQLDFIVMNPPFHAAGQEDKSLGQNFIRRAAEGLRSGGRLWLVANRHLPYEKALGSLFRRITPHREASGFKIIEAMK